jgi:hypothetical protein
MTTINPHTTRAPGTILTAAIYNLDHGNHIANAQALNAGKIEGAGAVPNNAFALFDGVSGSALKSGGTTLSNSLLANMAEETIKGRAVGAGTGAPQDLTATQATAILNVFTGALKGLVPLSGGGTANFLRADGTFAAPPSGTLSINIQVVAATATYNPTANLVCLIGIAQGSGAGGGGSDRTGGSQPAAGAGGGGGECRIGFFSAADVSGGVSVTINAPGGGGNASGTNGSNGGSTVFGALMTAAGGSGGLGTGQPASGVIQYLPGGAGGTGGSGGQIVVPGGRGGMGASLSTIQATNQWFAGNGGWSFMGGVTTPDHDTLAEAGTTGKNYGSGGTGGLCASTTGQIGGTGGVGVMIAIEFIMT